MWTAGDMVEVTLRQPDDFLKVRETLTRIGVASRSENKLYQSCHILHKQGRYFIVHFKELFLLDGKKSNLSSLAVVSTFNPKTKKWKDLTPLPQPRSSHEMVAHKGKLYVIGGWNMQDGQGVEWHHHGLVADLSENPIKWRKLPKTNWKVRANSAAVVGNSLFVISGLDDNGTSNAVRRLDLDTNKWSDETPFPGVNRLKAFGSAACNLNGRLLACGFSYQPRIFDDSNSSWSDTKAKVVGKRFFHRMVPIGKGQVAFIGGADFEGHLDSFEVLDFRKDLSSKCLSKEKKE